MAADKKTPKKPRKKPTQPPKEDPKLRPPVGKKPILGRPPIYRDEFCEMVIEFGSQGFSKAEMAAELGVTRETIYAWTREHPRFSDAMSRAHDLSLSWWEKKGRESLVMPQGYTFQQNLYSRSMAARYPDEWRENQKVEHSGGVQIVVQRLSGESGS